MKSKHHAELKHVDEEEELNLSSSDDDMESERLAEKFQSWSQQCMDVSPPPVRKTIVDSSVVPTMDNLSLNPSVPVSSQTVPDSSDSQPVDSTINNDNFAQVLLMQSQAIAKMLTDSSSSKSDKFMARQTAGRDLPSFSGQPEEWPAFIASYRRTTDMCGFSDAENMERLRRCLKGEAAKAVQCLMVSPNNIQKVIQMLEDRFGKTKHIITAMITKARQANNVKDDKPQSLIDFGTTVVNLAATIKSLQADGHLKNPQLLAELEDKLPYSIRIRWHVWKTAKAASDDIEEFAEWVESEMKMAYEMVAHSPIKEGKKNDEKTDSNFKKRGAGVHLTGESQQQTVCNFCGLQNHKTYQCRKVKELTANERVVLAVEKKLCLCCLTVGCSSRRCKNKRKCGINNCEKDHNRLFHGSLPLRQLLSKKEDLQKEVKSDEDSGPAADAKNQVNTLQAASLRYIQTEIEGPQGKEVVLALQDDGASITILEEKVREQIGAIGPTKPFCMATVEGDGYYPNARVIGMRIRGDFRNSPQFTIGNVRTIDELKLAPVSQDAEALKKRYPHLRNIPLASFKNMKPRMILGSSHYHLICPLKVIEGRPGEPVATKSRLGWTIIIPDVNGILPNMKSHQLNHVTLQHDCKEDSDAELHRLVKNSFTTEDFGVKPLVQKLRSKEDQRAIDIMESTMKRSPDGVRYEIGLLWKTDDVILPPSYNNALHRLKCQERKMDKDRTFAEAYCQKIKEYVDKGFIRKLDKGEIVTRHSRTWYLPHFGVVNPNKPGKLRLDDYFSFRLNFHKVRRK